MKDTEHMLKNALPDEIDIWQQIITLLCISSAHLLEYWVSYNASILYIIIVQRRLGRFVFDEYAISKITVLLPETVFQIRLQLQRRLLFTIFDLPLSGKLFLNVNMPVFFDYGAKLRLAERRIDQIHLRDAVGPFF